MLENSSLATGPRCFSRREAAAITGMSISWLRLQDRRNQGPPKLRMGNRVRYPAPQFFEWALSHFEK